MKKKIYFTEQLFDIAKLVEEKGVGDAKKYMISGKYTMTNKPNGNNRIYPEDVMNKSIGKLRGKVEKRVVKMCLDHPDYNGAMLKECAAILHEITDVQPDGYAYYKAQIIDEGCGKLLRSIIDAGGVVGVSTRGYGAAVVKEWDGLPGKWEVICDGFVLESIDFVDTPSVTATEDGVTVESKKQGEEEIMKTVAEFKTAYPELYEEIATDFSKKITDLQNSLDATKKVTEDLNKSTLETLTKKDTDLKTLTDELAASVAKLTEAQTKISAIEAENVKIEKEKEIEIIKGEMPEFFTKFAKQASVIDSLVTKDEVRKYFDAQKALIDEVKASLAIVIAPPKTTSEPAKVTSEGLTVEQKLDMEYRNGQRIDSGNKALTVEEYKKMFVTVSK